VAIWISKILFFHFGYNLENRVTEGDKLNKRIENWNYLRANNFHNSSNYQFCILFFFGTQFYTLGTSQAYTIVNQRAKAL